MPRRRSSCGWRRYRSERPTPTEKVWIRPVVCVRDRPQMRCAVAGAQARRRAGRSRGSSGARPRCARVPCDARSEVAPRNSLHSLRSLRSNTRGESDHEARGYARRPQPCASRRRHSPRLRPARRLARNSRSWGGVRGKPRASSPWLAARRRRACRRQPGSMPGWGLSPTKNRAASQSRGRVRAGAPVRRRGAEGFGRRAYARASSTDSPHLFERSERSERSELCGATETRAPQRSRRRRRRPPHRSASAHPPTALRSPRCMRKARIQSRQWTDCRRIPRMR